MAWIGLLLLLSLTNIVFSADDVVLTSVEKKSLESMDMSFGETDPVAISEVKREPAIKGERKQKRDSNDPVMDPKLAGAKMPRLPGTEDQKVQEIVPVPAPAEEKKVEISADKKEEKRQVDPMEEKKNVEKKEEPIKVQKRRSERRQHRAKKPPVPGGTADKDGIEDAL